MKQGTEHILFLQPYVGKMPNQQLVIVGAFQGRFDIGTNGQVTAASKISDATQQSAIAKINSVSELMTDINGAS